MQTILRSAALIAGLAIALTAQADPSQALGALAQSKDAVSKRASSSDPDWAKGGNADARPIQPGETLVLADLEGPGVINHIWFTIAAPEEKYPRLLALRMYWDDEERPSVEAPVGDFFAMGHGLDVELESLPVSVTAEGKARNCYWSMPFGKRARIEVTNEGTQPVGSFYYYIDWEQVPSLPENTVYFHAMYRQEYPARVDTRYRYADIEGRGHYVGTVHSARARTASWIGEGDDFFYLDGEKEPSLKGTGTEDYFCDAWGFRPMDRPFYGAPLFEGMETGDRTTVYRWHVTDPIRFNKSLYAEIEHVGPNGLGPDGAFAAGYGVRLDDISSVAFWYQEEPHKPWEPMPVGHERLYPEDVASLHLRKDAYPPYVALILGMQMQEAGLGTIRVDSEQIDAARFTCVLQNPTELPAEVTISFPGHGSLKPEQDGTTVTLEPGARREMPLSLAAAEAVEPAALQPVPILAEYRFRHPSGRDVDIPVRGQMVFSSDYRVEKAAQPVQVDGNLAEWDELPFVVTQPAQLQLETFGWQGPEDCRFRFGVRSDAEYLYVAVDVVDDATVLRSDQFPWLQDGVEIRLTALPDAERNAFRGQSDFDGALLFALSPPAEGAAPTAYTPHLLPEGAKYACVKTAQGHATEVAVPLSYLDKQQGKPWEALRLNVAVNDRDGDQQTQLWWRPDWRTPQTFEASGTFLRP